MLNVLRHQAVSRLSGKVPLHKVALRHASTAKPFVPPAALEDVEPWRARTRAKPSSPTFYTARASYYDQLSSLESCITTARHVLKSLHLHPLPAFARASVPPPQPMWKDHTTLDARLNPGRYRRILALLTQLDEYRRIAQSAGCVDLEENIGELLRGYEKDNKEAILASGKRKPVEFDEHGRTYTVGKRKESSARVWVIPVQHKEPTQTPAEAEAEELKSFLVASLPRGSPMSALPQKTQVTASNILINNVPLAQYFPLNADRERVIRPLQLTGALGAFNVFALVRGGGTTGQSGAVSLGLARGLVAHVPDVETILRKAKLLRRDPRMVERKKTGLRKARAARTWVKR